MLLHGLTNQWFLDADNVCAALAVPDAGHNRGGVRCECLQGTREDVISEIVNWAEGKDSHPICWLSAPAGFGESAIMQTLANRLDVKGKLAASFFFQRGASLRSEFTRFITTIAYHITLSVPACQPSIQRTLQKDPTIPSQSIQDQFWKLVVEPFKQNPLDKTKFLVVVVDALDECNDHDSIRIFITLLTQTCGKDSLPLRFLLASRAEDHIRQSFASDSAQSTTYILELEKFNADRDITIFLRSKFDEIRHLNPRQFQCVQGRWPSSQQLAELAKKSEGLFIFAATVVTFITDGRGGPQEKLKQVLESHLGLDPLYTQVLSSAYRDNEFVNVLSTIIYLHRQLSITALACFLDLDVDVVIDRLTEIQSIIQIPANNDGLLQLNHASFRDFLLDKERSKEYYLPPSCETFIVVRCMEIMSKELKRDDWPKNDAEEYACQEWCAHLVGGIRGCISQELVRNMMDSLQIFIRCDALEVWINMVIRDSNVNATIKHLSDSKSLLQV